VEVTTSGSRGPSGFVTRAPDPVFVKIHNRSRTGTCLQMRTPSRLGTPRDRTVTSLALAALINELVSQDDEISPPNKIDRITRHFAKLTPVSVGASAEVSEQTHLGVALLGRAWDRRRAMAWPHIPRTRWHDRPGVR
jgi:hypothetical protein